MYKRFLAILMVITLSFATLHATVGSHTTGYYSGTSLPFTIDTIVPAGQTIFVSVNEFSENSFHEYSDTIMLYRRDSIVNGWEDQQFTKGPVSWVDGEVDTLAKRGLLSRVNVVRVRIVDNSTGKILARYVYNIGLGNQPAITQVFITIDSLDAFGPQGFYGPGEGLLGYSGSTIWNYAINKDNTEGFDTLPRSHYEKAVNNQILKNNQLIMDQDAGIRISGNSSVHMFAKTMAVVARKEYAFNGNGPKMFKYQYQDDTTHQWKWLKYRTFRAHCIPFGANEIAMAISKGLHLCDAPVELVEVYINGSYWELAYMQEKINQYTIGRHFKIDPDKVSVMQPERGGWNNTDWPTIDIPLDTLRVYGYLDRDEYCAIPSPYNANQTIIVGIRDEGSKSDFRKLSALCEQVIAFRIDISHDTYDSLSRIIDRPLWRDNFIFDNHMKGGDIVSNNLQIAMGPNGKLLPLPSDFDAVNKGNGTTAWDEIAYQGRFAVVAGSIAKIMMTSPKGQIDIIRRTEDLNNTLFLASRADSIVQYYRNGQYGFHKKHVDSWGGSPNGGCYATVDSGMDELYNFFHNRTDQIWSELSSHWMPNFAYGLQDRNWIQTDFTHVVGDTAAFITINTLQHRSNFAGFYYPNPTLIVAIPDGYYLAEFPDSSGTFELYLTDDQTLTLLKDDIVASVSVKGVQHFSLFPNPTTGIITIATTSSGVITIVDMVGTSVLNQVIHSGIEQINMSSLPNGEYFIKVEQNNTVTIKKIIVIH